jgi:hypothetical protein
VTSRPRDGAWSGQWLGWDTSWESRLRHVRQLGGVHQRLHLHDQGRDHTTVINADRKIRSLMAERRSIYTQVTELINRIKQQARTG